MSTLTESDIIVNKYVSLRSSALHRGKEWNLTLTSIKNLLSAKKCYYSGRPLTKGTLSIDRIDNDKGYVIGNVCACHIEVNSFKGNLTVKEIKSIANKLNKLGAK